MPSERMWGTMAPELEQERHAAERGPGADAPRGDAAGTDAVNAAAPQSFLQRKDIRLWIDSF